MIVLVLGVETVDEVHELRRTVARPHEARVRKAGQVLSRSQLTPAQRQLVRAYAAHMADLWAAGRADLAERWADAAFRGVGGRAYVDDREVDR